jgi:crotonobetainyl-CoA:carnitine CoA-transferase CaiB-like acyl-CoA transferase
MVGMNDACEVIEIGTTFPGNLAGYFLGASMGVRVGVLPFERKLDPLSEAIEAQLVIEGGKTVFDVTPYQRRLGSVLELPGMIEQLQRAKVLITCLRPSTRESMGIGEAALGAALPGLHVVEIVGTEPDPDIPRHDLQALASRGLVERVPGHRIWPSLQLADISAGIRASLEAARTLLGRSSATRTTTRVGLDETLDVLTLNQRIARDHVPAFLGVTAGDFACYNLYVSADVRTLAIAALELRAWDALRSEVAGLPETPFASGTPDALAKVDAWCAARTADDIRSRLGHIATVVSEEMLL